MVERIVRLIKLDFSAFREIESDPAATSQAAIIVAVTSFISALGSMAGAERPFMAFLGSLVMGIVGWIVWSIVTYVVGKSLFKGGGTLDQMLRVLGYASAPKILGVLAFIPCLGWLAALAGAIISLIAGVMAIKEALDVELGTAVVVVIIGWIAMAIVSAIIGVLFGGVYALGAGLQRALSGS